MAGREGPVVIPLTLFSRKGWFKKTQTEVNLTTALTGHSIVDDGWVFWTGETFTVSFASGMLVNGEGNDLVLFNGNWSPENDAVSSSHDGFTAESVLGYTTGWASTGVTGTWYFAQVGGTPNNGWHNGTVVAKAVDLSNLGVPSGAAVSSIRVRVVDGAGSADFLGVGALNDAPVVSVKASRPQAAEGGSEPGHFTVERTGDTSKALDVAYTVATGAGHAAAGTDYTALSGSVTIAAGSRTATIDVAARR